MVTIKKVADKAGVSIKTVSRVINNSPNVKDKTREKVLEVIKELRYVPNDIARSLVTNQTKTIGILLSQFENPFFSRVIYGIEDTASSQGYSVIIVHAKNSESAMKGITTMISKKVDAIIIFPMDFSEGPNDHFDQLHEFEEYLMGQASFLKGIGIYVCLINSPFSKEHEFFLSIRVDDEACGWMAGNYLAKLGHTKIAHMTPIIAGIWGKRFDGLKRGLEDNGLVFDEKYLRLIPETIETAAQTTVELLSLPDPPTAIYCANDNFAFGAVNGARMAGKRVPEDLSIVGTDGINLCVISMPKITTISHKRYEIGHKAVLLIMDKIQNNTAYTQDIVIVPSLTVHESTAAPNLTD